MYLNSVLLDVDRESQSPNNLSAEHLYTLNEAVFNLPEDDSIDSTMADHIFQVIKNIRTSYFSGRINDPDQNFFYDYVALLGTMQNQHFFTNKQAVKMFAWMAEALTEDEKAPGINIGGKRATMVKSLELKNKSLWQEYEELLEMQGAVKVIQKFDLSCTASEPKCKTLSRKKQTKDKARALVKRQAAPESDADGVDEMHDETPLLNDAGDEPVKEDDECSSMGGKIPASEAQTQTEIGAESTHPEHEKDACVRELGQKSERAATLPQDISEIMTATCSVRPKSSAARNFSWRACLEAVGALALATVTLMLLQARRTIAESGVAFEFSWPGLWSCFVQN